MKLLQKLWGSAGILCCGAESHSPVYCYGSSTSCACAPDRGCCPTGAQGAASALLVPHCCFCRMGEGCAVFQCPLKDGPTDASHSGTGSVGVGAPCWGAGGLWAPVARHSSICTPHTGPGSSQPPPRLLFPQLSVSSLLLQLPSLVSQVYRAAFGL